MRLGVGNFFPGGETPAGSSVFDNQRASRKTSCGVRLPFNKAEPLDCEPPSGRAVFILRVFFPESGLNTGSVGGTVAPEAHTNTRSVLVGGHAPCGRLTGPSLRRTGHSFLGSFVPIPQG